LVNITVFFKLLFITRIGFGRY